MTLPPLALLAALSTPAAHAGVALLTVDDLDEGTRMLLEEAVGAVEVVAIIEPIYDEFGIIEPIYDEFGIIEPIYDEFGIIEPIYDEAANIESNFSVDPRGIIEPIYLPEGPLPALLLDGAALPEALTRHSQGLPPTVLAIQDADWLARALEGDDAGILTESLAIDPADLGESVRDPRGHATGLRRVDAR
jgi:hypothetical protein